MSARSLNAVDTVNQVRRVQCASLIAPNVLLHIHMPIRAIFAAIAAALAFSQ